MKITNKLFVKFSDKILLLIFIFVSLLLFLLQLIAQISLLKLFVLSSLFYSLALLCIYFISRKMSGNILDMTFKVEEMAAGNFSKKITISRNDELGQLANALNELLSRLKTGIAQDVSKERELTRAKSDFVSLASHQLRTPLSIIKWYVDFIVSGDAGELNAEQHKYLQEVYLSNERLIELVNALLDVSRIDVGTFSIEPEPTDILEQADKALDKFAKEIKEKKIKIEKKYDELPKINMDTRLTNKFFENIFSNSVKYTPEGGLLQIVIRKTEKDVLIKISDNGCGIPREQQPKIFTKLFRADNVKKMEAAGTGLGLYISKAIIEKSGGHIWFQSPSFDLLLDPKNSKNKTPIDKRNQGTTFFITIPLKGMKRVSGTKRLSSP